jgi:hypothetical protein
MPDRIMSSAPSLLLDATTGSSRLTTKRLWIGNGFLPGAFRGDLSQPLPTDLADYINAK